jgi:hypothetical protein
MAPFKSYTDSTYRQFDKMATNSEELHANVIFAYGEERFHRSLTTQLI